MGVSTSKKDKLSRYSLNPWIIFVLLKNVSFIDGLRVTSSENLKVAEMVLSGTINKEIITKQTKFSNLKTKEDFIFWLMLLKKNIGILI